MDAELLADEFFDLLRDIAAGDVPIKDLKKFIKDIEKECKNEELELSEFLEEVFPDVICQEVNEIINDSDWRSDEVGPNCVTDPELLENLFPILTSIDENVEVVFATNPHTPIDLQHKLSDSSYSWEEDGTASALARNTTHEEILTKLATNSDPSIRYSVAENRNTPINVLLNLAQDEEFSEHMLYMTFDGGMSPHAKDLASEMIRSSIKYALLHNMSTPIEVITQIAVNAQNFSIKTNKEPFGSEYPQEVNLAIKMEAEKVLQNRK